MLAAAGGRAPAPHDLHVTLCFLGAVGEAQLAMLCERAAKIEAVAFELAFDGLALWRTARMVVASAARVPTAGAALSAALVSAAREAGLAPEVRSWRPHVTLLRGVAPQFLPPPATSAGDSWPLAPLTLPVSRFYLAQSQGLGAQACGAMEARRYATLASWPLRA